MTNPNSSVIIEFPGMGFGKNPSVLVSNSESVSGSVSHVGIFVLTSAVTEADAVLADELPALVLATVVNV